MQGTFEDRVKRAFAGKYDVGEELGRGGMAVVYHAVDPADGSEVAVKVLRPEFTASIASERWIREIELARSLDHPGILPFLETGEADGLLYIVMPVVKGGSLKEKLQGGQLPVEESLSIASEVADALAHAHVQGIVHRDIKPANILFGQNQVYVADFGMAKATTIAGGEELTESGVAVGTPAYMSPEQAAANPRLDGRSDIYSLGCVLFEMLVGDPPFTGPTAQVIIARQLQERPPSVRVVRPSVPEEVEHLVSRSLAKSAADRFKDSAEFAREMQRLAGGDYSRQIRVFNHDVSRRDLRKVAGFGVLAGL
ncbi:MAG: serine/threonine protein kinase, partial [Gemmatimonadota bacterium]|nr:serine/threonine protein kinase [Gemmatimonadota bacterium]